MIRILRSALPALFLLSLISAGAQPPPVMREFRAAWVATVANINWPSKPGLPVAEQQREAIALLDFLQAHRFNAVIFQVRPQADALYESRLEPWSYYLTGQQGRAPEPRYDPLTFWIDAAHARGIELHVWLNPYRAHHKDGGPVTEHSIVKKKPKLARFLAEGYWWLDPAEPGTQDHSYAVAMDIVKRYDIDGLHFDDYFYPYPSYNNNADFPDEETWQAYQRAGGQLSRGDWRRDAVNRFIERLYRGIKAEKPHVKFGLSPFGIWRPGHPPLVEGFDQYDQLYADAKLWLNRGWVDYFTPQLYWPINRPAQSFPVLLGWWAGENTMHRHLWPGMSLGRDTGAANVREIQNQVMITRGMVQASMGQVHWSMSSITRNPPMAQMLPETVYSRPALVPASPWLDSLPPAAPLARTMRRGDSVRIVWNHPQEKDVDRWVIALKYGNRWQHIILPTTARDLTIPAGQQAGGVRETLQQVWVSAVDRCGNESRAVNAGMEAIAEEKKPARP